MLKIFDQDDEAFKMNEETSEHMVLVDEFSGKDTPIMDRVEGN